MVKGEEYARLRSNNPVASIWAKVLSRTILRGSRATMVTRFQHPHEKYL